jgi:hypothetical protein
MGRMLLQKIFADLMWKIIFDRFVWREMLV